MKKFVVQGICVLVLGVIAALWLIINISLNVLTSGNGITFGLLISIFIFAVKGWMNKRPAKYSKTS